MWATLSRRSKRLRAACEARPQLYESASQASRRFWMDGAAGPAHTPAKSIDGVPGRPWSFMSGGGGRQLSVGELVAGDVGYYKGYSKEHCPTFDGFSYKVVDSSPPLLIDPSPCNHTLSRVVHPLSPTVLPCDPTPALVTSPCNPRPFLVIPRPPL